MQRFYLFVASGDLLSVFCCVADAPHPYRQVAYRRLLLLWGLSSIALAVWEHLPTHLPEIHEILTDESWERNLAGIVWGGGIGRKFMSSRPKTSPTRRSWRVLPAVGAGLFGSSVISRGGIPVHRHAEIRYAVWRFSERYSTCWFMVDPPLEAQKRRRSLHRARSADPDRVRARWHRLSGRRHDPRQEEQQWRLMLIVSSNPAKSCATARRLAG